MTILEYCNNNYADIKWDNTNYFQRQIKNHVNNNDLMVRKNAIIMLILKEITLIIFKNKLEIM